ncbi:MAG: LURP-one-related family protein, partial [Clostridia bacterium]|nr:LURP-one-related family protein [Clostridia bacterium]
EKLTGACAPYAIHNNGRYLMGVFSKYHRFHEEGEQANVNNVERFGEPVKSLYTSTKVFTLHHRIEITDDRGEVVYRAQSKAISLHDRTELFDAQGSSVAKIWKKVLTLHERHFIAMADGTEFQLSNELWHLVKDITNIEGLGWQLRGNIIGLNFELYDTDGSVIAVIGQKMLSLHDKYCIDIYRPEHEQKVVAILITLQHMIRDRQNSSSTVTFSSSSGN